MINGFENFKMGLLGEKLGHSFSPLIHQKLADYEYKLYEVCLLYTSGKSSSSRFGIFGKARNLLKASRGYTGRA